MSDKPNILIVHNYYRLAGGEAIVVANEKKLLEEHGHKVVLYTRSNNELRGLGKLLLPLVALFNPKTYKEVREIVKREHIGIVHVHNTISLISPAVYYAALSLKKPIVQTLHNFRMICAGATLYRGNHICEECLSHSSWRAVKYKCYRNSAFQTLHILLTQWIHRNVYKKINFICLTEFNRQKLLESKRFQQIDTKKLFVKPNFEDIACRPAPQAGREKKYVFVGRLEKIKGIELLLEAWKEVGRDRILEIYGTGPLENELKESVKDSGLRNVVFKGQVPHSDVVSAIGKAQALIVPSLWHEGFPLVTLEAFATGTPVIGTCVGNVNELVTDGVTGKSVDFHKLEEVLEAMKFVETHDLMGNCRGEYEVKYTAERNYEALLRIYEVVRHRNEG